LPGFAASGAKPDHPPDNPEPLPENESYAAAEVSLRMLPTLVQLDCPLVGIPALPLRRVRIGQRTISESQALPYAKKRSRTVGLNDK
jgi:hypothetical protein